MRRRDAASSYDTVGSPCADGTLPQLRRCGKPVWEGNTNTKDVPNVAENAAKGSQELGTPFPRNTREPPCGPASSSRRLNSGLGGAFPGPGSLHGQGFTQSSHNCTEEVWVTSDTRTRKPVRPISRPTLSRQGLWWNPGPTLSPEPVG